MNKWSPARGGHIQRLDYWFKHSNLGLIHPVDDDDNTYLADFLIKNLLVQPPRVSDMTVFPIHVSFYLLEILHVVCQYSVEVKQHKLGSLHLNKTNNIMFKEMHVL